LLLESIKIENFLPFKGNQEITFSTDLDKNVTLIQGDNGAGKTSFAQAFEWCLYGKTTYNDANVINAEVAEGISPGSFRKVSVQVKLMHDGTYYTITRTQRFSRSESGRLAKPESPEFDISYREKADGQTEHVPLGEQPSKISQLLSSELSHYFFFDGEHVKNMRREIEKGRSTDFASAVKSLLGLQHIATAIEHLQSSGNKASVTKAFRQRFSEEGDDILVKGSKEIELLETRIERLKEDIEDADAEADIAADEKKRYQELLKENKESEDVIRNLESAKRKVATLNNAYLAARKDVVLEFREGQYLFFAQRLLSDALQELVDEQQIDKGVPDITSKTIEFLIKEQHRCICGADLDNDLEAVNHLTNLLKFIPPRHIGTLISNFTKECNTHLMHRSDFSSKLTKKYTAMRDAEKNIDYAEKERDAFQTQFNSLNNIDIANLRRLLNQKEQEEKRAIERKGAATHNRATAKSKIDEIHKQIASVTIQNESNIKIRRYLAYATHIHDLLSATYAEQEVTTKREFEQTVNDIFRQIYEGELWLQFDENYGVTVCVEGIGNAGDDWKTSTGQTLAITLAFIAGILKIARKNMEDAEGLLAGNTYPLVMDAPLSEFDTKRIQKICEVLPEVAEQIIVIAFDKDVKLIEEHLGNHIGNRYEIDKVSDYESHLEVR